MAFADNWFESECYRQGLGNEPEEDDEEENDMAVEDADAISSKN